MMTDILKFKTAREANLFGEYILGLAVMVIATLVVVGLKNSSIDVHPAVELGIAGPAILFGAGYAWKFTSWQRRLIKLRKSIGINGTRNLWKVATQAEVDALDGPQKTPQPASPTTGA